MVQADASAPALSEKVIEPAESLRERVAMTIALYIGYGFEHPRQQELQANAADWQEDFEERERRLFRALADKVLEQINIAGQVTFSNESGSDAVSLKQTSSSQPNHRKEGS